MPHHRSHAGYIQRVSNGEAWTPGRARSDGGDSDSEQTALSRYFKRSAAIQTVCRSLGIASSRCTSQRRFKKSDQTLILLKNGRNLPKVTVKSRCEGHFCAAIKMHKAAALFPPWPMAELTKNPPQKSQKTAEGNSEIAFHSGRKCARWSNRRGATGCAC
jgi:hypothetical protein